ncbi:NAD-dependent epimerase/dehydratase family protein [Rhodococcus tukisamuensis]|uniref:UDP-glucose 4-epimerase n=1 Tax=Rhodococcus tukisamuensis TaxID=168276 RepID=A0A1G6MHP0_9NOCA|nr:NAD-dependent epimerase/dehydratase family protein [Rhodococcus tukisamuensis]SDC55039.1 UDP-glucose 4-epimerase [Rhodococcus tukisamuensis]
MATPTWVVGGGGLLGGAVIRELERRGERVETSRVPWHDGDLARRVLFADAQRVIDSADGGPWRLVWCAGVGVNGTTADEFAAENAVVSDVLDEIARITRGRAAPGVVLHASSAGGVYAGSSGAPHTEDTDPVPLGDYGRAKLVAERLMHRFGADAGASVVVGRFANLYGPGQNLTKPQGLISHLCRGYLVSAPISIYVPMDTMRDYLFVTDAAEMVADALDLAQSRPGERVTKIFASGQSTTIGALLGACRTVFRRKPTVVLASSPLANVQSGDLRLRSTVWPELDRRSYRTLPAGIAATLEATRRSLGR